MVPKCLEEQAIFSWKTICRFKYSTQWPFQSNMKQTRAETLESNEKSTTLQHFFCCCFFNQLIVSVILHLKYQTFPSFSCVIIAFLTSYVTAKICGVVFWTGNVNTTAWTEPGIFKLFMTICRFKKIVNSLNWQVTRLMLSTGSPGAPYWKL